MELKTTMDYKIQNPTDNQEEPLTSSSEIETIESWTFLGDDSTHIHSSPIMDNEKLPNQLDDDAKVSLKTSHSSSSSLSENLLSVINHADGDISDGISVISDCDSLNDRHSPMPPPKMLSNKSFLNDNDNSVDATQNTSLTLRTENVDQYTLVERSDDHEIESLTSNYDFPRYVMWNPTNIILFGLIVGAAAILSSRCWLMSSSSESMMPELSSLAQRIKDLESENFALKVEVSRLVDLHHAGHDHFRKNEKTDEKRPVKVKEVWSGEDETPIHIPKYPAKEDYCNEEYLQSDDLFASYNAKKCEIVEVTEEEVDQKAKLKNKQIRDEDNDFKQFEARKKKNLTKDDTASHKRQKFAESKAKNVNNDNHNLDSDSDEIVRNEKLVKLQEERQKLYDEAEQKYSKRQQKLRKNLEKDRKHRDSLREQNASNKNKDTDSDWYDKMMKQREELRAMGLNAGTTKQQNKENWYIERANQREKVRGKHEKQAKIK